MNTMIFYGGIFLVAISAIGAVASCILLKSYKKRIEKELDKEYGQIQNELR